MIEPANHFVHALGVRLRCVDWGDNGPDALLLHGDMRTSRSWDAVARDVRSRFHVVSLDARGHGDSDWPETGYRYDDRIEDVADVCRQLGLKDVVGVGHSSGGAVIALAAQRYPTLFSRLALLEPVVVMSEEFQRRVSRRADVPRSRWRSLDELRERLKNHAVAGRWREDVIEDVIKHEAMELPNGLIDMKWAAQTMRWAEREGDYFDLKPVFRALGIPMLFIVSGERAAQFRELEPLAAELPNLHIVRVERTGHNMYMERPDAVARLIGAFVNRERLPEAI